MNPTTSLTWYWFYPQATPSFSYFPQNFVGTTSVYYTPAAVPGYQMTVSAIFFDAPAGYCGIGSISYYTTLPTWYAVGSQYAAILPYGLSTNLEYYYEPRGETQDYGCGWDVRWATYRTNVW